MSTSVILFLIIGLVLLAAGAESFVRGAARIAALLGISPLVVGLTVVAFGTSSPELAVGLQSSLAGQAGVSLGNVIGSNIVNVLLILGLSATIAPLVIAQKLIRLDVPIMIGVSALMLIFGLDGTLSRLEGLIFIIAVVAYVFFSIYESRRESLAVRKEYEKEYGPPPSPSAAQWLRNGGMIVVGLILLVLGSDLLVESAVTMARSFGVSDLVIGLTVVAIGTSLPEIATSIIATIRGERDIVVGNIVGSNIFNILLVLGGASIVAPGGLPIPEAALHFDIPVMLAVAIACLPIFVTGYMIARWEGILFMGYFMAYVLYLILEARHHEMLALYGNVMLVYVIPITVVTLIIVMWRSTRARRERPGQ